jgi:hypothetical protein
MTLPSTGSAANCMTLKGLPLRHVYGRARPDHPISGNRRAVGRMQPAAKHIIKNGLPAHRQNHRIGMVAQLTSPSCMRSYLQRGIFPRQDNQEPTFARSFGTTGVSTFSIVSARPGSPTIGDQLTCVGRIMGPASVIEEPPPRHSGRSGAARRRTPGSR